MTPADVYVRLVSRRLAGTGTVDVGAPDASVTGWLAACARSQGLAIRLPILPTADSLATATLTAAVALREATPGAGRQWLEVRSQLGEASPELALVLGLDAALTAGDLPTVARLQAELAGRDWSDELVAVVAADLLPVTGSNQPAAVMLHPGGGPVPLTTATWTTWSGRLIEDLRVTATPGSLIALEIVAQSERVAVEPTGPIPRILRLQSGAESMRMNDGTILAGRRFVPLAPGTAVEVGETLALDYPHDGPWVLPALVRLAPSGAQVLCQDRVEETWSLPENSSTNGPRRRIAEMYVTQIPIVLQRLAIGADAVSALSGRRVVDARLVLVEVCAQGVCALGAGRLLEARAHVERDEPEPVFPLMSALQALYDRVGDEDREFLLLSPTATVEDWRRRMAVVDPQQEASLTLAEIVSHPACGRRGHHLTQALRRWIDGEPAFDALTAEGGSLAVSSLGDVMQIVSASRAERELAIAHLPFPHPAETSRPHAIRAWVERCLAVQALQIPVGVSVVDWLWSQPVSREEYRRFGYRATVDEWRRFLVEEFGFQVRIGRGIPAGDERAEDVSDPLFTPDGGRLGFERLAAAGLELVQMGDALEIRSRAEAPVLVSLFTHDALLSQAVAQLNRQLTARGLREIRYDAIGDEPRVTLQLDGLLPRLAIEQLARQTGSQVTAWRGTVRLLSQQMAETPSSVP